MCVMATHIVPDCWENCTFSIDKSPMSDYAARQQLPCSIYVHEFGGIIGFCHTFYPKKEIMPDATLDISEARKQLNSIDEGALAMEPRYLRHPPQQESICCSQSLTILRRLWRRWKYFYRPQRGGEDATGQHPRHPRGPTPRITRMWRGQMANGGSVIIQWTDTAKNGLANLPKKVRRGQLDKVNELRDASDPTKVHKPLKGPLQGYFRICYSR